MKIIFSFIIGCLFINSSCTKKYHPPPNNNEIKATIVLSSGSTINFNARGAKAKMGCLYIPAWQLGPWTEVDGTNEADTKLYMVIFRCGLSSPFTYDFVCNYTTNVGVQNPQTYTNNGFNPGSITFTKVNDQYMEGYFTAVCRLNMDSVIVTGTFKGDYLYHN